MSAHDELLKIHRILLAPEACPAISDDDTLTIRLLKDLIIWHRHQRQIAFGPQIAAMQQSQSDNIVANPAAILELCALLEKAEESMEAFTDPEGDMPEDTGEFRDLAKALAAIKQWKEQV